MEFTHEWLVALPLVEPPTYVATLTESIPQLPTREAPRGETPRVDLIAPRSPEGHRTLPPIRAGTRVVPGVRDVQITKPGAQS